LGGLSQGLVDLLDAVALGELLLQVADGAEEVRFVGVE